MKKILLIVGVVIVVLFIVVALFLGNIVKAALETAGPKIAGVPITVEHVRVRPLTGKIHIKGLIIGNPEGFHTPSAMELGQFKANIKMGSLFTDTIVINEILIEAPEITYEKSLRSSNLSTLQDNLAPNKTGEPALEEDAKKPKEKAADKKVIIEDFQLNDAKVHVTITALGGKKMTLPLPDIQMTDIGKDTGGTDIQEVISEIFNSITTAVGDAVTSSGAVAGDALKDAGGKLKDVGGDAAGSIKKGLGGLFGKD